MCAHPLGTSAGSSAAQRRAARAIAEPSGLRLRRMRADPMATLRRQLALRGRITRHVPKEHNLQHETRMNATFSDVRRKSAASCTYVGRAIVLDGCRHVVESRRDDCRLRHVLADRDPRPVAVVADVGVVDVRRVSVARVDGGVENLNRRAVCNSPMLFGLLVARRRQRDKSRKYH